MNKMKKHIAVAVTVALLAFPLSSALANESNSDNPVMVATTVDQTDTTVAEAAEAPVSAYEAGPLTSIAEVTTAEGLKAAADTAVAAVVDVTSKTALELRITTRATAIASARTVLETPVVDENGNTVISSTWFTELIGKLQLALTFDPVRKGELNERHALAKLAQAQQLMKDGKFEAAQISIDQYTDKIAKAQAFLEQVEDPTSETAKALDIALVNVNANNIVVLGNLLDKLPEQAAQKLALNVVRTMEKAVTKIEKEEAKIADPIATQVITADTEKKNLEKHTKVALAEFKKSIREKGKIHIEDQDNEKIDGVNKFTIESKQNTKIQSQVIDEKVTSDKKPTTPTFRTSDNQQNDQNKQENRNKDKVQDNRQDKGQDNRWDHK